MYCKANGCIDRPHKPADGIFDAWNELIGLIPASFAACVVIIHIIWVLVRDLIQENVDLSFLLDDDGPAAAAAGNASDVISTSSTLTEKSSSETTRNVFQSTHETNNAPPQSSEELVNVVFSSAEKPLARASQTLLPGHITGSSLLGTIKPAQSVTSSTHHRFTDDDQHGVESSKRPVETRSSGQPRRRTVDSPPQESGLTSSGAAPDRTGDSAAATRWIVECARRAPVGSTPAARSAQRPTVVDGRLTDASTVDRGCSPFRYSDLSALGRPMHADAPPTDAARSCRTISPSGPRRRSFPTSPAATHSDRKSCQDRRGVVGSVGARSIDFRRHPSPTGRLRTAADYRRDALERQRHLRVLESNRTLEKFMRVLRQEEEAKATAAALVSAPTSSATCRQRSRTVSFAVDREPCPVTSSRAGTGNGRRRENERAWSTTRWCSSTVAADDDCQSRSYRSVKLEASNRRDIEEGWTSCLDNRGRRASSRTTS